MYISIINIEVRLVTYMFTIHVYGLINDLCYALSLVPNR